MERRIRARLFITIVAFLATLPFAFPTLLMFVGSLKSREELTQSSHSLYPRDGVWHWENYRNVLSAMPFEQYLKNSIFLCLVSVVASTIACSAVAFGLSRVEWRGRKWVLATVLLTLLLPWQLTMIPRFVLIVQLGLYDSLWAIVLPTFFGEAFFIFLLRQFFLSIPQPLLDAGRIDGLSDWGLFIRIVMPLSKPALVTVALFQFIETWNNFGGPLLYLSDPNRFPLTYGLERFVSSYGDQTHWLLAGAVLFSLPLIVFFLLGQRYFTEGITAGSVKS